MGAYTANILLCRLLNLGASPAQLAEEIRYLSAQDWETLLGQTAYHGVTPFLFYRLQEAGLAAELPASIYQQLHDARMVAAGHNIAMQHHASILLTAFKEQSIHAIPLKGLNLAGGVYPAIGLRTFGDLDFMIRRREIPAALEAVRGLGYNLIGYAEPAAY